MFANVNYDYKSKVEIENLILTTDGVMFLYVITVSTSL